ncbi:MAG: hypothetical protein EPN17_15540 [Methylobacter sp.]|nr:MAG: hypothetical protein EPN17_15540 [Methylobacter sp.]
MRIVQMGVDSKKCHLFCNYSANCGVFAPSPVGEGWGEENKNKHLYPPHPTLSRWRGVLGFALNSYLYFYHEEHEEHEEHEGITVLTSCLKNRRLFIKKAAVCWGGRLKG